jgi:hypothetical protein
MHDQAYNNISYIYQSPDWNKTVSSGADLRTN